MERESERKLLRVRERRVFLAKVGRKTVKVAVVAPAVGLLMAATAKPAHAEMYHQAPPDFWP